MFALHDGMFSMRNSERTEFLACLAAICKDESEKLKGNSLINDVLYPGFSNSMMITSRNCAPLAS